MAEEEAAIAIYMTEQATRALASGAKVAYDEASKAVTNHKKEVSSLQSEYDNLKDTIDRALGIDKEIEVADRSVERADISLIRAKQDLENIRKEIEEARSSGSTEDISGLLLRERSAILDVADAEDRYDAALAEASKMQADKAALEEKLNGASIESAQTRLETLAAQLETEQTNLENALAAKEKAQISHENLMDQINVDALNKKSADWATYVQYVADNPAIAATYHVEYDKNGNAIGGLPKIAPVVDIPLPSYASLPEYNTLPADGLSNMTRGSTVDANSGNTPQTVVTNSPTVIVNAQTNASPGEIAMTASREVGRLYAGGSGI